ncbi:MAG: hypothetical protein U1A27_09565 [Phycisphaerae bacterium]
MKVRTGPVAAATISATTSVESTPPDSHAPSGTSLISRRARRRSQPPVELVDRRRVGGIGCHHVARRIDCVQPPTSAARSADRPTIRPCSRAAACEPRRGWSRSPGT